MSSGMSSASEDPAALWPGPWPAEDGGPRRRQAAGAETGLGLREGRSLQATSRLSIASTMVVLRDPGEVFLLCHTGGDDAVSWVEQIDPLSLETIRRSSDLPGGPTWPGGLAAHADGDLYVVFGAHAHRLSPTLETMASTRLPRQRPYNSFVVLPDGSLATKDFAGTRPGGAANDGYPARLSADGSTVYAVCDRTLRRLVWDGERLELDDGFAPEYRTLPGQSYGWDAVLDGGAAWFLDDGEGSERFAGSFSGVGTNECPLHLVRVDLATGEVSTAEVCGRPGGLIANPPAIDVERGIAVGYDSSNTTVTAWSFDEPFTELRPRWSRSLAHAMHPLRFPATGELLLNDHDATRGTDQVVVVDIDNGDELGRVDTGSPVQSVLFGSPGWHDDAYVCSFTTVTRIWSE